MSSRGDLDDVLAQLSDYPHALRGASNQEIADWLQHIDTRPRTAEEAQQGWIRGTLDQLSVELKEQMRIEITDSHPQLEFNPTWSLDTQLRAYFEDKGPAGYEEFIETLRKIIDRMRGDAGSQADTTLDSEGETNVPPQAINTPILVQGLSRESLQAALRSVKDRAEQLRAENPRLAQAGGVALIVGGGVVIVPAASAALLLATGFGPLGPIAGTLAPLLQSVFYGAQTGGIFSFFQAMGMTIVAPSAAATAVASAVTGVGAWFGFGGRQGAPDGPGSPPSDEEDGARAASSHSVSPV